MQILVRAPEDLKALLQFAAKKKGITLNAQVLQILWAWADEQAKTIKAMKKAGYTVTERRTGRGQANSRAGTNDNPPPGGAEAHDRKRSRQEECQLQ